MIRKDLASLQLLIKVKYNNQWKGHPLLKLATALWTESKAEAVIKGGGLWVV